MRNVLPYFIAVGYTAVYDVCIVTAIAVDYTAVYDVCIVTASYSNIHDVQMSAMKTSV